MTSPRAVVLVPLKSFSEAKSRLRDSLGAADLLDLSQQLAAGVIVAARPLACVVLCEDEEVEDFAHQHGAQSLRTTATDLNGAVDQGYRWCASHFERVIIAHGDLARPTGLGTATFAPGATIVTDRHGRGTNVLALPTGSEFTFSYGEGSAQRHAAEARRLHLDVMIVTDSPWGLDIDDPDDLQRAGLT